MWGISIVIMSSIMDSLRTWLKQSAWAQIAPQQGSQFIICLQSTSLYKSGGGGERQENQSFVFHPCYQPLLHYLYDGGRSVSGQMFNWSIDHNRQCPSQQQTPSLHQSCPWTERAMETHSGHTISKCFCLSILAIDFDEMKWSITKFFFLFPIYVLKVLLRVQRDPRCIRNKRKRGGRGVRKDR